MVEREDLVRVDGPAEVPPEQRTMLACDDDGELYRLTYNLGHIQPTDDE